MIFEDSQAYTVGSKLLSIPTKSWKTKKGWVRWVPSSWSYFPNATEYSSMTAITAKVKTLKNQKSLARKRSLPARLCQSNPASWDASEGWHNTQPSQDLQGLYLGQQGQMPESFVGRFVTMTFTIRPSRTTFTKPSSRIPQPFPPTHFSPHSTLPLPCRSSARSGRYGLAPGADQENAPHWRWAARKAQPPRSQSRWRR